MEEVLCPKQGGWLALFDLSLFRVKCNLSVSEFFVSPKRGIITIVMNSVWAFGHITKISSERKNNSFTYKKVFYFPLLSFFSIYCHLRSMVHSPRTFDCQLSYRRKKPWLLIIWCTFSRDNSFNKQSFEIKIHHLR